MNNENNDYRFFGVEIVYAPKLKLSSSKIYVEYAQQKPEKSVRRLPGRDVHTAYFKNENDAEEYRNRYISILAQI